MERHLTFATILFACLFAQGVSAQDHGVRIFAQTSGAVAWVETISADSLHRSRSSGVVLKHRKWLLTTFHGYQHGGVISARVGATSLLLGKVITADKEMDLVVMEIVSSIPHTAWAGVPDLATLTSDAIEPGADVYAIGNPNGAELTISYGLASGLRPFGVTGRKLLQFSAPVSEGNSGGALVDGKGRLLGLPTAWHADGGGQALNFALPMEAVFAAVASSRNDLPTPNEAWIKAARAYLAGNCAEAFILFAPFISNETPQQHDAAYRSARCLQRSGDLRSARNYYERLVEADPLDAKSMYRLGEVVFEQGEVQRGLELLQRAGRLKPELLTSTTWD